MRAVLAILLLVLTMVALGMREPASQSVARARIVHRLIDDAPAEIFDPAAFTRRSPRFTWHFDDTEEWSRWTRLRTVGNGNAGLAEDSWVRQVVLETTTVEAIELSVSRPPRGMRFVLSWAAQGELFAAERALEGRLEAPVRGSRGQVWFDLRDHPRWRGTINRLRLRLRSPQGSEPAENLLRQLSGVAVAQPTAEQITASRDRFWKVDLGGDVRSAFMVSMGAWRAFNLDVPKRATLRLAFGSLKTVAWPVTVRVEAFCDGRTTTLFSGQIDPSTPDWQPAWIDLGALAGRPARIRFRVLTPAGLATTATSEASTTHTAGREPPVVAWAHPEVLQANSVSNDDTASAPAGAPPHADARPHVVLVSVDTLRADHLSLYGYERSTSPNLDAWAARHAGVFLNTVAQAPWTLPSHVSMLSGINAHRHGVNHDGAVPSSVELLAERLRRAGYTTIAVTGGGFLHPRHGFSRGFDRYVYWRSEHRPAPKSGAASKSGADDRADRPGELALGIARALEILEQNRGEPLFLFFHTYETHAPYVPREPYFSELASRSRTEPGPRLSSGTADNDPRVISPSMRLTGVPPLPDDGFVGRNVLVVQSTEGEPAPQTHRGFDASSDPQIADPIARLRTLYDSGVAYTDAMLRLLLERIERAAEQVPSVVVVTSDHGEALGEGGRFGHADLYDDTLLVPLVIRTPSGLGAGSRIDQQVRSIDIVPTVLELAGLPPAAGIDGHSLSGLLRGEGALASPPFESAWSYASNPNRGLSLRRGNRLKFVWNSTAWAAVGDRERYFDLRRDAGERRNLAGETETAALRAIAREALADAPGLRVRIIRPASASEPLSGELRGPAIHPLRVEQVGSACACVHWSRDEHARFSVAPGQQLDLLIEEVESPTLTFALPARWGHIVEISLPLDQLDTRHILSRRPKGPWTWHPDASATHDQTAGDPTILPPATPDDLAPDTLGWITVWWQGERARPLPGTTADADLGQALRALGYL